MTESMTLTIAALARQVGLSEGSVRKLADKGVVPCTRNEWNHRIFDLSAVDVLKARVNKRRAKQRAAMNRAAGIIK